MAFEDAPELEAWLDGQRVVWMIGLYTIVFGVTFIVLGFRLRQVGEGVAALRGAVQGV